MKKIPLGLIIGLILSMNFAHGQIPSYVPTNGLIAWYPFTGNANDLSGNNLNGTVNGATLTTDRFGNPNCAYSFNGTSDYISMGNPSLLNITGSISISYWIDVNQNPIGGYGRVIDKGIQNQSGGYISDYLSNGLIRFGGSSPFLFSNSTLSLSNWYNVIIVRNMQTDSAFIYLNGVLDSTFTSLGALSTDTTPFWVGGAAASGGIPAGVFFNGKIDDLAIWNRGLTHQEVIQIYSANGCSVFDTVSVYDTITVHNTINDTTHVTIYDTVITHVYDTLTTITSTTDTLIINVALTGINPPGNLDTVKVFPNPAHDHLQINIGNLNSMSGYTIKISNPLGQVVFTTPVNQQSYFIDLNTWTGHGVYIMYILDPSQAVKSIKEIVLQ